MSRAGGVLTVSNIFYIYEHWRLDRDECFYVGKGKGLRAYKMQCRNRHHKAIQAKVSRDGSAIEVRIVASGLEESAALELECKRIQFWRDMGVDLTNLTRGGDGVSGLRMGAASREKMRAAKIGKKLSIDHRKKLSAANKGREFSENHIKHLREKEFSPQHRANLSKSCKGRQLSLEHIEKTASYNRGRKQSKEHIQNAAATRIGKPKSDMTKNKISIANAGKIRSEKAKENMRAAQRKWREDRNMCSATRMEKLS